MQKEDTKTIMSRKKYGKAYEGKEFLRHGDIQLIADASGFKYVTVIQQLSGDRKIRPAVKAAADELVSTNKNLINRLSPSRDN